MRHRWPADTVFTTRILVPEPEERICCHCGRTMTICDHRRHPFYSFDGPQELIAKLVHCPASICPNHHLTFSPLAETSLVLPGWLIGWDVFCWIGHRRFARHWSVTWLRQELLDSWSIRLSDDSLTRYCQRYQLFVAARQQDPTHLAHQYQHIPELVLTIDGVQPEKGHETLYVVRECNAKRVWFAEPLLSSSNAEVRRLLTQAHQWAQRLGKPIRLWMSDKQDAFVDGIAAEFPGIPHRYCANHFLRDLAKPMLEEDSHAKVKMRRSIRGLRAIERQVLEDRQTQQQSEADVTATTPAAPPVAKAAPAADAAATEQVEIAGSLVPPPGLAGELSAAVAMPGLAPTSEPPLAGDGQVVLDYCAVVRGILNDDQGGPCQPPGLRMSQGLREVQASVQRCLQGEAKKGGVPISN